MASRALAATVLLAFAFGAALRAADLVAGQRHEIGAMATTVPSTGGGAATAPLLLVSISYFLAVAALYLDLIAISNPDMVAPQRLAVATAFFAAVMLLLALSAAVYEGGCCRPCHP
ncbi:hypothetical protein ACP70R_000724 [Stipagrostis hirtigluma subsp. patula]